MPTTGWRPDRLSSSVLSSASSSFLRVANRGYNQSLTAGDLQSAAANNWALMKHLHEVGFHKVALAHIARHRQLLTNPDPSELADYYESVQRTSGLQVPLSYYSDLVHAPASSVQAMLLDVKRSGGVGAPAKRTSRALMHYSTLVPSTQSDSSLIRPAVFRSSDGVRLVRVQRRLLTDPAPGAPDDGTDEFGDDDGDYLGDYFYDGEGYGVYGSPSIPANWCWYMEWAGIYIAVMSLPIQVIPVIGQVLAIAGIAMAVVGLVFNC